MNSAGKNHHQPAFSIIIKDSVTQSMLRCQVYRSCHYSNTILQGVTHRSFTPMAVTASFTSEDLYSFRLISRKCFDKSNTGFVPALVLNGLQGQRLACFWRNVLIRRTNSSRMPCDRGSSIGESLLNVNSVTLSCTYTTEESQTYHDQAEKCTS